MNHTQYYPYQFTQNPLLQQYQTIPQYSAYVPSYQPLIMHSNSAPSRSGTPFSTYGIPSYQIHHQPSQAKVMPGTSTSPSFVQSAGKISPRNASISVSSSASGTNGSHSNKQNDDLRASIQVFVKSLESTKDNTQTISTLSSRFTIKRRRLYDVINVFEAIGCCEKSGLDSVKWVGRDNIVINLQNLKEKRDIDNRNKKLEDLFPIPCCVGISNLTISFLLLFFAMKIDRIDLRYVSHFFSRNTTRYKTTLCKLYQICYILGSIGVTSRTSQVCEVILNKPYFSGDIPDIDESKYEQEKQENIVKKNTQQNSQPLSIGSLLNHQTAPVDENDQSYVFERRRELKNCYVEFSKKEEGECDIEQADLS